LKRLVIAQSIRKIIAIQRQTSKDFIEFDGKSESDQ
jgi:hypothetical protein